MKDQITLKGRLSIRLYGPDGKLKDSRDINNLVVSAGKALNASRLVGAATPPMSHMAIGSGVVAPAAGDVALGAQLGRVALTSGTSAGAVATFVAAFGAGIGTGAVTEAGIFNDPAAGTMLSRATFAVVNKDALDTMSITWTVTAN
jgi:hypothetical protein